MLNKELMDFPTAKDSNGTLVYPLKYDIDTRQLMQSEVIGSYYHVSLYLKDMQFKNYPIVTGFVKIWFWPSDAMKIKFNLDESAITEFVDQIIKDFNAKFEFHGNAIDYFAYMSIDSKIYMFEVYEL